MSVIRTRSAKQIKLNLLLLVFVAGETYSGSASARLLQEDHDFSVNHMNVNPSAFDPNLNFVVDGSSNRGPKLGSEVARSNNPRDGVENVIDVDGGFNVINTESTEVSFEGKNIHCNLGCNNKAKELVFNVFPKGTATPSGPSHKGYATVTEQRLSASKSSPGVGRMQIPYDGTVNGMLRSKHSPGVGHMQQNVKRILGSVPSPGVGHR